MKIKTLFSVFLAILATIQSLAQISPNKYYIQFTDKNNSPYSINNPQEFLTQRSIERRANQGIPIVENDIPVNVTYLQGVAEKGANLLFQTRWFNGVTVETNNPDVIEAILTLPYVQSARKMVEIQDDSKKSFFSFEAVGEILDPSSLKSSNRIDELDYGFAYGQIDQINGIPLHNNGFKGEGMVIAVLDGGFSGANVHPVFDSLWNDNRVLGTKDFVHVNGNVFTESEHGKMVLSDMAAYDPGNMIGTAPMASYWLLRSEDVNSENFIEEFNWVSAAEFADSVGADVINSSLSYRDYDMPEWTHEYEDLNGVTCIVSLGADIAVSKGIFVCNSAGNSGNSDFPWNGAPADGFSVFSIGALEDDGDRASFSSIGPTADGRIRPVVMAWGQGTTVAVGDFGISYGSGTSFASPIIAGMTTCLWQANPTMTVPQIQEAIKMSSSNSISPDNFVGWGTPDYEAADALLTTIEIQPGNNSNLAEIWPNPFSDVLNIKLNVDQDKVFNLQLSDITGSIIYSYRYISSQSIITDINNTILTNLVSGMYILKISTSDQQQLIKLIKR